MSKRKREPKPLIDAVLAENMALLKELVASGEDVNQQDSNGFSGLHFAAQNYTLDIAQFLVDVGADVDIRDVYGNTPLSNAVFNSRGRGEMIQLLLSYGADRNLKNTYGVSPKDLAETIANYDVAQFSV